MCFLANDIPLPIFNACKGDVHIDYLLFIIIMDFNLCVRCFDNDISSPNLYIIYCNV